MTSAMRETMWQQPADLTALLADRAPVEAAARRVEGKRLVLVGTGTSWHAANHSAWFLRAAGVDARPVQGMDAALYGTGAQDGDAVIVLSHRNTKRFTTEAGGAARTAGTELIVIGGRGSPDVDIETTEQERSAAFTASHLGALMRMAQLADAARCRPGRSRRGTKGGRGGARGSRPTGAPARAAARADRGRPEPVDRGGGRPQGSRDVLGRDPGTLGRAAAARTGRCAGQTGCARLSRRRRAGRRPGGGGREGGRAGWSRESTASRSAASASTSRSFRSRWQCSASPSSWQRSSARTRTTSAPTNTRPGVASACRTR